MTREQYEQRKQRLEEQLRAGIQLLESAHQAQVRALDMVWMLQAEEAAPSSPSPPTRPARSAAPAPHALEADLREALPRLPEEFTRGDVCEALGYKPDRGTLYRILRELVQEGSLRLQSLGSGRRPSIYRKTNG
jgi:hypothetical protein